MKPLSLFFSFLFLVFSPCFAQQPEKPPQKPPEKKPAENGYLIYGERIFTLTEKPVQKGYLWIKKDRIHKVIKGKPPTGVLIKTRAKVIFPGLVDAHCFLGTEGSISEKVLAFTPSFLAEDGYDPYNFSTKQEYYYGLTSFILATGDKNLISGKLAGIQNGFPNQAEYLLRSALGTKISLSQQALLPYRDPTSMMGAAYKLERFLQKHKSSLVEPYVFLCESRAQIRLALKLIAQNKVRGLLYLRNGALFKGLPAFLKKEKYQEALIIEAPSMRSSKQVLQLPAQLDKEGYLFAFGSHAQTHIAAELLIGANLAISEGLPVEKAMAAITKNAATIFKMEQEIGSLKPGSFANIILATDIPLNLSALIQGVLVKGKVIAAPKRKKS